MYEGGGSMGEMMTNGMNEARGAEMKNAERAMQWKSKEGEGE